MKIAAVVLESWKLKIFKRHLDEGGYEYEQFKAPVKDCVTLRVKTETIADLEPVIIAAQEEAVRSKQH